MPFWGDVAAEGSQRRPQLATLQRRLEPFQHYDPRSEDGLDWGDVKDFVRWTEWVGSGHGTMRRSRSCPEP